MKRLFSIACAIIAVVFMASCAKEGPMGPMGPMGPTGPQGPAGNDGYVNVASTTITVVPDDWYWDETSWRVDFSYDAVTSDIYNSGVVLVYMESNDTWRQIPMTFYYSDYDNQGNLIYCSSSLETSFYEGGVSVFWTENDFYDGYRPEEHRFRLVAIAAGYYAAHPELDLSSYEMVKETFNLAD
ncbi:MAG: hypothetical protein IKM99_07780 [Bacteroidales bacterium]|nr:hypothetical protein [Bacteroidales bacterium]